MNSAKRRKNIVIMFFLCSVILASCTSKHGDIKDNADLLNKDENKALVNKDVHSFFEDVMGQSEVIEGNLGNMINEGQVCETEDFIYYGIGSCLYKNKKDADEESKHLLVEENEMCREICVVDDYVYYITSARIKRINKNGGEAQWLTDTPALYMQVTEDKIYFSCNGVYSMNLDGSNLKLLTKAGMGDSATSDLIWLNLYKDYVLYVSTEEHMALYAVKKDASEVYCLQEHVNFPVVEGDCVYYQDEEEKIVEYSFLTGELRSITDSFQIRPIFMDGKMYCTDYFGIYCFDTETGEKDCVYPNRDTTEDAQKEDNIDLFWLTENYIFFKGNVEKDSMDGITYMDYAAEIIDVLK